MDFRSESREGYAPFDLYSYNPATGPAYASVALFAIAGVLNLAAMIPYRSWFPIPLIIGCGMEAVAYYFRAQSHDNVRQTLPFLIQNLLLLSSPPFLAASIYMSPRRIARAINSEHLVVMSRWSTKLFVLVDLACFVTQVTGAIMSGDANQDTVSTGKTIILAGLILQVVAFGVFLLLTSVLHGRAARSLTPSTSYRAKLHWQRPLYGLYVISTLFICRNVTRIIEYNQGSDGTILSDEAYLYALDACVMWTIVAIFLVFHPGRLRMRARKLAKSADPEDVILLD